MGLLTRIEIIWRMSAIRAVPSASPLGADLPDGAAVGPMLTRNGALEGGGIDYDPLT